MILISSFGCPDSFTLMLKKVTIIGGGSWATALTKIFSESKICVSWLLRTESHAQFISSNGYNPRYLSSASLDMKFIEPVSDAEAALQDSQLVIFAVPSSYLYDTLRSIDKDLLQEKQLAVSIKGFVPYTGYAPSGFIGNWLNTPNPIIVIGGPCHAEEVAMKKSTYLTISGTDQRRIDEICSSLDTPFLRVISNNDPTGIEYTAILKNIIGIASGIAKGLNYGDNFQAVLVSNTMKEVNCFLDSISSVKRNLFDSAYFGDLLVTAYSDYSRNRTLGKLVGRGIHVSKAIQAMEMIAEGFHASRELAPLIKKIDISLPVINTVHRILHQHANAFHEFKLLEKQLN